MKQMNAGQKTTRMTSSTVSSYGVGPYLPDRKKITHTHVAAKTIYAIVTKRTMVDQCHALRVGCGVPFRTVWAGLPIRVDFLGQRLMRVIRAATENIAQN